MLSSRKTALPHGIVALSAPHQQVKLGLAVAYVNVVGA
jgi:hypothetical protein